MKRLLFLFASVFCLVAAVNAQYKVGDYYEKDGLKGIVVRVDNSGEHGLIMSLENCSKKWLKDGDEKFNTNAYFEDDGEKNMAVIEKYIKDNGKSWELFPYFQWCLSLGEGWYAPATDELKDILTAINGGPGKYNAKFMKQITKILKAHKGDGLINSGFGGTKLPFTMYSSTEGESGHVYVLYFKQTTASMLLGGYSAPKGDFIVESVLKTHTGGSFAKAFGSRAVHKF